jgi:hypothetical protein
MIAGFAFNNKDLESTGEIPYKKEVITISSVKHIVLSEDCNVDLLSDTSDYISYHYNVNNKNVMKPDYKISNDTLFIMSTNTNTGGGININVNQIESISGNNCRLDLDDIKQNSLRVELIKSKINIREKSMILKLSLQLQNSQCNAWHLSCDDLNLNLNDSKLYSNSKTRISNLTGKINNKSKVQLPKSLHYNLDVDKSSSVRMN